MRDSWDLLRTLYVDPLLRCLEHGGSALELGLIIFGCGYPYSQGVLERGGWVADLSVFRQWLDDVQMQGGGSSETRLLGAVFLQALLCLT